MTEVISKGVDETKYKKDKDALRQELLSQEKEKALDAWYKQAKKGARIEVLVR